MIIALGKGASRSGSGGGVGNYYLYGTNGDRDTKDSRIVLHGNLDTLVKTIDLAHQMNYKETYRNIVLSFSEDYVHGETLEHIVEDFKKQYMAGYDEEEYVFYAEAHLPKIKIKKDANTGETIHRKPHIHITVPTYSPKLDKALSLGNHRQRLKELDTWKSVTEKKYGLKPAQNSPLKRDMTQIYDTKLLGRKEFIELCNQVIEDNLKDKILDKYTLKMTLLEKIEGIEDIKESTSKTKTPYFAIKMKNSDKPMRLKGDLFSSNHLVFKEAREQLLKKKIGDTYCEVGKPRNIPTALQNTLDTYYEKRIEYVQKREAAARAKLNAVQSEFEMIDLNGLPTVQKEDCRPLIGSVK